MQGGRSDEEALRRRVYGADATEADVARYRALVGSGSARPGPGTDGPPAASPPRLGRRARLVLLVAAVVLVLGGGGGAVFALRPPAGTGPAPVVLQTAPEARAGFLDALRGGGAAGIAAYLLTHPGPAELRTATRYTTLEDRGEGAATVRLDPPSTGFGRGRATVLVVLEVSADVTWRAEGLRVDEDEGVVGVRPVHVRSGTQPAGELTSATFGYRDGDRPVRLRVEVPDGVRWGVAVVFSD